MKTPLSWTLFSRKMLAACVATAVATSGCATFSRPEPTIHRTIASDKAKGEAARNSMHVAQMAKRGPPQGYTTAIKDLANHQYVEVMDLVLDLLDAEIMDATPNSYVLNGLTDVIEAVGLTPTQVTRFQTLSQKAATHLSKHASWTYVQANFVKATKSVGAGSTTKLATLPPPDSFADWAKSKGLAALAAGTKASLSDDIREAVQKGSWTEIIGRDDETDAGLDVLVRVKGKVPVFIGEPGVGKTAAAEQIVYRIHMGQLPPGVHAAELTDAIVIQTTAAQIARLAKSNDANSQADAIEAYFADVKKAEKELGKSIIVFLDEAHTLSTAQLDALKPLLESRDPVRMIWATTGKEMGLNFAADEAVMRRVEPILLEEFDADLTAKILRKTWVPVLEKKYAVTIGDDVLRMAIEVAPHYRPEVRRPSGPFLLLQDLSIAQNRVNRGAQSTPSERELLSYAAKKSGLPVLPQDRAAFVAYMDRLKVELKAEVRGQTAMIDRLVDQFSSGLARAGERTHSAVMILGTTGIGKTMVAEKIGEKFYGNKNRIFTIDMTAYADGEFSLNALFGAPSGVVSSDKKKGELIEFLEGRGKGGGVIIMNEIEKAHPDVFKRFMEVLDKGEVTGGDGKPRKLGRTLIVMTSNKGATEFFPPDVMNGINRADLDRRIQGISKSRLQEAFLRKESYAATAGTPPEVVQRVDDWLLASPLLRDEALEITQEEADKYAAEFARYNRGGKLSVSRKFVEKIVDSTFNVADGVREVKRRVRDFLDRAVNAVTRANPGAKQVSIDVDAPAMRPSEFEILASDGANTVKVEGPKVPLTNPMMDPEIRGRLKNLEPALAEGIIDQDEAVRKVADVVRASSATPGNKSPASVFLAGRTGTGKTELARKLAKARYGSDKAIHVFNMGSIKNEYELNDIFSPPKGISGSDTAGPFEKLLNDYPDGAVIVFDEMSNAGGGDRAAKEAIAKRFYQILDDGEWSSPSRRYTNLSKFTFIFTGNDGEQLFRGLEDDDLLLATWKSVAGDKDELRKILLESGFPEAFLGRIKAHVMMKPPSFEAKMKVARKLLDEWKTRFSAAQPFEVVFAKDTDRELARLMYSSSEGARSLRNFIDSTLGSLAAQSIYDFDWDALAHAPGKITVSIEATSILNPFYWLRPGERKATVKIVSEQNGTVLFENHADFTGDAKFMKQVAVTDAWLTAYHEAGHAVMNPKSLEHLTIVPSGNHLGYARYKPRPLGTVFGREELVRKIAVNLAGSVAEEMIGRPRNMGATGDIQQTRDMLRKTLVEGSLIKELDGAMTGPDGKLVMNKRTQEIIDKFANEVIEEASALARSELTRQWRAMVAVSNLLIRKGSISGDDFRKTAREAMQRPSEITPKKIETFIQRLTHKCQALLEPEI